MSESLGTLIDKVTVLNLKLWHLEDTRRDLSLPDSERLAAADKVSAVNAERSRLIEEIDEYLAECLANPARHRIFKKFPNYKGEK